MSMFIRDLTCISPQPTFENDFFDGGPIQLEGTEYQAIEPSYQGMIPNGILRRMGKSNRLATGAAMPLLSKYRTNGIIIGTTDGGMNDCHKFLNQIIQYEEGTLTPTGFVQGSPNSAAGGLALMNTNDGYNITHSNKGLSFENCLMDAMMLLEEGEAKQLLVGAVEEISPAQLRMEVLAGFCKSQADLVDSFFDSNTPGSVAGEGAAMFVVDQLKEDSLAEIVDVAMISNASETEVNGVFHSMLNRNGLAKSQIDAVVIGLSGDSKTDPLYHAFLTQLPDSAVFTFKNLFGESPSASAFATWIGAHILSGKKVPASAVMRPATKAIKTLLIYNHFQGSQHGFVLLRAV